MNKFKNYCLTIGGIISIVLGIIFIIYLFIKSPENINFAAAFVLLIMFGILILIRGVRGLKSKDEQSKFNAKDLLKIIGYGFLMILFFIIMYAIYIIFIVTIAT